MLQRLVSHNDDIRRLVEKGYAVAVDSDYLVVRDIPYLDAASQLRIGAIVTKLEFVDQQTVKQTDHQIFFAGAVPHDIDGRPIPNLGGGPHQLALSAASGDVVVERSFSNKPTKTGYFEDFFAKIESYVAIISGPALEVFDVTPYTFRATKDVPTDSVFKFQDTLTSRAEIVDLSAKFAQDIVAIIGLGGTGAYVLDFLVKMPIREIRGFDIDAFHVHNAFRSPGRLEETELGKPKTTVYQSRYENFRGGLSFYKTKVGPSCPDGLEGVTFAFVCVDDGPSRAGVFDLLLSAGVPFIDVGMGLKRKDGALTGLLRTTYYSAPNGATVRNLDLAPLTERPDDVYQANIQIAELNALNAALAVLRFKQLRGFYREEYPYFHVVFGIDDLKMAGECEVNQV